MGVYYIQNLVSNKFYVGSSFDVYNRIKSHLNLLQRNCHPNIHIQRSYSKHGQGKFAWGICEEVFDIDQLLIVEQAWIDVMGDYNICTEAGSTRGYVATEETRAKMSAARLGSKKPNVRYKEA
jgi:group I intron endonuclease